MLLGAIPCFPTRRNLGFKPHLSGVRDKLPAVSDTTVPTGIYERLLTQSLLDQLDGLRTQLVNVDEAEQADVLGDYVGRRVTEALREVSAEHRVDRVNQLLALLHGDVVSPGPQHLMAVAREEQPGVWRLLSTRPAVPLSRPALLTNASSDPKLGSELRAELATADRVDLLCAFIKWSGLRILEAQLKQLRDRRVPLRVLTTTYMGATERQALDRLVNDLGAQVKVNYETQSTRLHAKAWLLRRASGYDTAYVGSSNLSRAALLDGLEWNVKLAGSHTPELLTKFEATFDSYWEDPAFVSYDPTRDGDRLDEALAIAGGKQNRDTVTFSLSGLQVRAYPHQQEILDRLQVEREVHDRHRNLVVAATGTGKTVVAALDYARQPRRPSLLFVAHRQEILEQSLRTYREVLADGAFGELYVGGSRPSRAFRRTACSPCLRATSRSSSSTSSTTPRPRPTAACSITWRRPSCSGLPPPPNGPMASMCARSSTVAPLLSCACGMRSRTTYFARSTISA